MDSKANSITFATAGGDDHIRLGFVENDNEPEQGIALTDEAALDAVDDFDTAMDTAQKAAFKAHSAAQDALEKAQDAHTAARQAADDTFTKAETAAKKKRDTILVPLVQERLRVSREAIAAAESKAATDAAEDRKARTKKK